MSSVLARRIHVFQWSVPTWYSVSRVQLDGLMASPVECVQFFACRGSLLRHWVAPMVDRISMQIRSYSSKKGTQRSWRAGVGGSDFWRWRIFLVVASFGGSEIFGNLKKKMRRREVGGSENRAKIGLLNCCIIDRVAFKGIGSRTPSFFPHSCQVVFDASNPFHVDTQSG